MSNVTNKTELISGGHIYRNYKDAMHLLDPDDVKEFFATMRVLRSSLYRSIFDPDNVPYEVKWHHAPTATIDGWVQTGFANDEQAAKLATFTEEPPDKSEIKKQQWMETTIFRKHKLNKRSLSYIYMMKMHLEKYGDQAYANIGTILPNIPEALIGSVTNLKKMDIIEDPEYLRDKQSDPSLKPTTIRLHAREVIDLARANRDFEELCWEEWEQTLLDPKHVMEFNKEGKISIDPVLETQIAHFIAALNDAFYANALWQVFYHMASIMESGEVAARQLQEDLTKILNETLEYIEAYNTRYTTEILELAATTKQFNNMFADVKDNLDILEEALTEDGILKAIAKTIENMHDEVEFIDEQVDSEMEQLEKTQKYAQTSKATIWKRIKEIENRLGETGMSSLVEQYLRDYKKGNVPSIQDKLAKMEEESRQEEIEKDHEEELVSKKGKKLIPKILRK